MGFNEICEALKDSNRKRKKYQVFVGFDGYIDKLVRPVRFISKDKEMDFFNTIDEFGTYISGKVGKSGSVELHKIVEKPGGNAILYATALAGLGISVKCVGAFGYPQMVEIFKKTRDGPELISISNPGICTALEFTDGKIMLSESQGINKIDYQLLVNRLGEKRLCQMMQNADMISLMNWSEVPGSTDIWEGILAHILPKLPTWDRKKMFVDISDCSRRTKEDIKKMVGLLSDFSEYCDVTLSLNKNELEVICGALGIENEMRHVEQAGERLREICRLNYLVLHMVDGSYAFGRDLFCYIENKHIDKPYISTGGGDNFNAGLAYGLMLNLDIKSAMIVANALSGFYVSYGISASLDDVVDFISQWREENEVRDGKAYGQTA